MKASEMVPGKSLMRRGVITVTVGLGGLGLGYALFPESNLLGGFAVIFAPVVWVGVGIIVVAGVRRLLTWRRKIPR